MKVQLQIRYTVKGFNKQLKGVHYKRIKGRARKPDTGDQTDVIRELRKEIGDYYPEWRILKTNDGYCLHNVFGGTGMGRGEKTIRDLVISASWLCDFYVDEPFEHEKHPEFKKVERQNEWIERGCKHPKDQRHTFNHVDNFYCFQCGQHSYPHTKKEVGDE